MFHAFDNTPPNRSSTRPEWMALLARAPLPLLEQGLQSYQIGRQTEWLRRPETGLYMVQGRVGGTGERFNLGEVTVTRCALRHVGADSQASAVGVAYVLGRQHRQAELAALADALLQEPEHQSRLEQELLTPVRQHLEQLKAQRQAQIQSTKVDFFTVAREAVTEAQDTRTEGMARNTLALVLVQLGRMQDARTEFGRADLLLSSVNDTAQVALNLTGLAWTLMLQDEHLQALQHNERLLRLYRDGNARWELANTFLNVGHSHARLGHGAAARSAYGHALSLTAELDAPSLEAEALGGVADLLWREGQPQRASRLYAAAQVHPGHNAEFEMFFAHLRALPCPAHVPTWAEIRAELQQELTPDTPSRPPDHQAVL